MNEIQDEPETMPCIRCGSYGSFLIVERTREHGGRSLRYVYENTHHNRTTVEGVYVDHYFCGACGGKGKVPAPKAEL